MQDVLVKPTCKNLMKKILWVVCTSHLGYGNIHQTYFIVSYLKLPTPLPPFPKFCRGHLEIQ